MKEIVEKISSYNLFNNLLPGVIYVGIIERVTTLSLIDENLFVSAFLCYFIGMIIGRVGSLLIEPLLIKIGFLRFKDYSDFIEASKKDEKIDVLSEQNNTYRTLVTMTIFVMLTVPYDIVRNSFEQLKSWDIWIITGGILILFVFSYRKQTKYIFKRVEKNIEV